MKRSIFTAGMLGLVIASNAAAFGHAPHGGDCDHGRTRILRQLDLSADQKQQVEGILATHRNTLTPLLANEKTAERALRDKLLGTSTVAQEDIDPLIEQESQARTAVTRERLATALEVRNVLTPVQRAKATKIRTSMKELHAQMRQLLGLQHD